MDSQFITLLGFRHHVYTYPAVPPEQHCVLALHGFGTTGRSFRHASDLINAAGITIVAPDQLNFGKSDKPEDGYSLYQYAQLTVDAKHALGLERPVLMGHSAGGKVAAATVALFPNEFSGLILVNTGGFSIMAPLLLLADTRLLHLLDHPFLRRIILSRFGVAATLEAPEQWEAFLRLHGSNADLDIDRAGLRQAVQKISIPTRVIWGQLDKMIPKNTLARIHRDIPHAEIVAIDNAGHSPMKDQPEAFARHVIDFVRATGLETETGSDGP